MNTDRHFAKNSRRHFEALFDKLMVWQLIAIDIFCNLEFDMFFFE